MDNFCEYMFFYGIHSINCGQLFVDKFFLFAVTAALQSVAEGPQPLCHSERKRRIRKAIIPPAVRCALSALRARSFAKAQDDKANFKTARHYKFKKPPNGGFFNLLLMFFASSCFTAYLFFCRRARRRSLRTFAYFRRISKLRRPRTR